MGDTEKLDKKPEALDSSISFRREEESSIRFDDAAEPTGEGPVPLPAQLTRQESESAPGFQDAEAPTGSAPNSQDRSAPVRRSSLRPAPPSFRPSARDAGQLRPAMVVHAGDADPGAPTWDLPEPPPSQPSQVPLDSAARLEPFALAEDHPSKAHHDRVDVEVPPPAALPEELRQAATSSAPVGSALDHRRTLSDFGLPEKTYSSQGTAVGAAAPSRAQASRKRRIFPAAVTAVGLVGVIAGTMAWHRTESDPHHDTTISSAAPSSAATESLATSPKPQEDSAEAPGVIREASATPQPSAVASAVVPNTVRVTLEIKPTDAKVIYRGVLQPGPPFVFEVPKGKRIAVEVARFGFVTRKVVIDDKKPNLSIGLLRAPTPRR